jgi:RND family efflux transporter MFP subunit
MRLSRTIPFAVLLTILTAPAVAGEITAPATVTAARQAVLRAGRTGMVLTVEVSAGERVEPGRAIARLDAREAEFAAKEADSRTKIAMLGVKIAGIRRDHLARSFDAATHSVERARAAAEAGTIGAEELAEAEAELERARLEVTLADLELEQAREEFEAAKAAVYAAEARTEHALVLAPIAGVVASVAVSPGDSVRAHEDVVAVILDPSELDVVSAVDPEVARRIHAGASAWVAVDGESFKVEGKVSFVSPVVDPEDGLVEVCVRIRNSEKEPIRPGRSAQVRIRTAE